MALWVAIVVYAALVVVDTRAARRHAAATQRLINAERDAMAELRAMVVAFLRRDQ